MQIKVGNINNLSEARYFAARGADRIGFKLLSESHRKESVENVKMMMNWISGIDLIAEIDDSSAEVIINLCDDLGVKAVQTRNLAFLKPLCEANLETFFDPSDEDLTKLVLGLGNSNDHDIPESLSGMIIHADYGQGLAMVPELGNQFPLYVDITKVSDSTFTSITKMNIQGIQISGEDEVKPGMQDFSNYERIFDFIETNLIQH